MADQEVSDLVLVLRKFFGGTVGGVLQAASSHPFDTVKSRVQMGVFPGAISCFRETLAKEGIRGFYRGVTPPLFLSGVNNSVLFGVNQYMTNVVTPVDHDRKKALPLWRTAAAAQLTAPVYCAIITPMELVKVKLQVQSHVATKKLYEGPVDCIKKIVRANGLLGLQQGYLPTVGSRLVGLPFYFGAYAVTRNYLAPEEKDMAFYVPMLSGVAAGCTFWASNYPFDYTKTQVQATGDRSRDVIARVYKAQGVRGFYKGFATCLLRSIPANSTVWIGIEYTTKWMKAYGY
jgi:solute carrier family 25 (mitochondrial carnitine/acylcarnitine transporter), member 20/29